MRLAGSSDLLATQNPKVRARLRTADSDRVERALVLMERRLKREMVYVKVAAVEDVMLEGWLYDVSVAEHDNFVAGGMLVHRTS